MICSRPNVTNLLGAEPGVSRAIQLISAELCGEKPLMQRSRPSISQSRRRRVLWRVFEVKYYEYILFRRVPELQPEGGCMRSPGRRSPAARSQAHADRRNATSIEMGMARADWVGGLLASHRI